MLNLTDLDTHNEALVDKVEHIIRTTTSKREMAKAMTYCVAWGGTDTLGIRCYNLYSEAVDRISQLGFGVTHIESYLPKSWLLHE